MRPTVALAFAALVTSIAPARATTESVSGRIVDLACYSQDKTNTGNNHRGRGLVCAQACAREGFAVGLLTAAGKVYEVGGGLADNHNAKLVPHMTHMVTITGDVTEKDGRTVIAASDLTMNK